MLKIMGRPVTDYPRFDVDGEIGAVVCSNGADHVCIVFVRGGKRIASFASDGPGRTSYVSEAQEEMTRGGFKTLSREGLSLMEAIELAKKEE